MRQVARRLKDGALELVEVPEPSAAPGHVLVEVAASVISVGTERATLEAAEKNFSPRLERAPTRLDR